MMPMRDWWLQREKREQTTLLSGALLMAMILLYGLWQPLAQQQKQLQLHVNAQHSLLQWMQQAAQQARALQTQALPQNSAVSLLTLLDESLLNQPLQQVDKHIMPKNEQQVVIEFAEVDFAALLQWLVLLANRYAIDVDDVQLTQQATGLVKAHTRLTR
jgi:type II secretory pathway component PulM